MRLFTGFLLTTVMVLSAQTTGEKEAIAVVQRTLDGIAAHDGAMIRSTMLPDARIYVARDAAVPTHTELADMIAQIAADKSVLLERFTSPPRVLIRGRMAQVWGIRVFARRQVQPLRRRFRQPF